MRSLSIASSGMLAQQTNVDVISHNIANMNTTGFKSTGVLFREFLMPVAQASAFAGDDDLVGGAQRLAAEAGVDEAVVGDAEFDILGDEGIQSQLCLLTGFRIC